MTRVYTHTMNISISCSVLVTTSFAIALQHVAIPGGHLQKLRMERARDFAFPSDFILYTEHVCFLSAPLSFISWNSFNRFSQASHCFSLLCVCFYLWKIILCLCLYFILESSFIAFIGPCFLHISCQLSVKISPSARRDLRVCFFDGCMSSCKAGDSSQLCFSLWLLFLADFVRPPRLPLFSPTL